MHGVNLLPDKTSYDLRFYQMGQVLGAQRDVTFEYPQNNNNYVLVEK